MGSFRFLAGWTDAPPMVTTRHPSSRRRRAAAPVPTAAGAPCREPAAALPRCALYAYLYMNNRRGGSGGASQGPSSPPWDHRLVLLGHEARENRGASLKRAGLPRRLRPPHRPRTHRGRVGSGVLGQIKRGKFEVRRRRLRNRCGTAGLKIYIHFSHDRQGENDRFCFSLVERDMRATKREQGHCRGIYLQ